MSDLIIPGIDNTVNSIRGSEIGNKPNEEHIEGNLKYQSDGG